LDEHATYRATKPWAKRVAELLEAQMPKLVVSKQDRGRRRGKVLVDWSQNDAHKTTVNVYSVRAKDGPTVSTPVTWEEVEAAHAGARLSFTVPEVLARVGERGDLFAPVRAGDQALPRL